MRRVTLSQRSEDMSQIYLGKRTQVQEEHVPSLRVGHALERWSRNQEVMYELCRECSEREKNDRRV